MYELNYKTKYATITMKYFGVEGKAQLDKDLAFYQENWPSGEFTWEYTKIEEKVVC